MFFRTWGTRICSSSSVAGGTGGGRPVGPDENSPALQGWDFGVTQETPSPVGTTEANPSNARVPLAPRRPPCPFPLHLLPAAPTEHRAGQSPPAGTGEKRNTADDRRSDPLPAAKAHHKWRRHQHGPHERICDPRRHVDVRCYLHHEISSFLILDTIQRRPSTLRADLTTVHHNDPDP